MGPKTLLAGLKQYKRALVTSLVVPIACLLAYEAGLLLAPWLSKRGQQPTESIQRKLEIAEEELNLGTQHESAAYEHVLHITNPTDAAITVEQFRTSCDCVGVTPRTNLVIDAHETKPVSLKLKLLPKKSIEAGVGGGDFSDRRTRGSGDRWTEKGHRRLAAQLRDPPNHLIQAIDRTIWHGIGTQCSHRADGGHRCFGHCDHRSVCKLPQLGGDGYPRLGSDRSCAFSRDDQVHRKTLTLALCRGNDFHAV